MNTSSSSSCLIDTSLHEDIEDLLFPELVFDQDILDIADDFIRDLDPSVPQSSDNESMNNKYDNNINNENNDVDNSIINQPHSPEYLTLDIHSPIFPVSSSAPNLDIPLSPLNDQSSHSQASAPNFPPPSSSHSSNQNVPLKPVNDQPQPLHSFHQYSIPVEIQTNKFNAPPNQVLPQPQSHYSPNPPNHAPSTTDPLHNYWNSNNGAADFINYDHFNNTGNGPAVVHCQVNTVYNKVPPVKSTSISQPTINPSVKIPSGSVEKAQYKQVKKGQSCQRGRFFPTILPIDKTQSTKRNGGGSTYWFFLLQLLMDASNKSIIIWTGHQRFFRVIDKDRICKLWARHSGKVSDSNWKTAERNIRTCGAKGILMPVPSKTHKGRNEDGLFGFMIEPSHYVGMTREEMDKFIVENCETAPLQQPQGIAPSNASAPAMHNQFPQLHQQVPLQPQYPPFQPQTAHHTNAFPYYPNFNHYQQNPLVMHSQFQPTNYRYSPY